MKILVSACLLGENCKYSGGNNYSEKLANLISSKKYEVVPVCPEILGGLPTPRDPSEIVNGIVTNCKGIVVDSQFRTGAQKALEIALSEKIDFAILKANSPSCGHGEIYNGTFSGKRISGNGLFAQALENSGIKIYTENEISEI